MFISKPKHDFIQIEKILRKKGVFLSVTMAGSAERKKMYKSLFPFYRLITAFHGGF